MHNDPERYKAATWRNRSGAEEPSQNSATTAVCLSTVAGRRRNRACRSQEFDPNDSGLYDYQADPANAEAMRSDR